MAESAEPAGSIANSLRRHVLAPTSEARSLAEQEYEEVERERQAFQRFKERVAGIRAVSPPAVAPKKQTLTHRPDAEKTDRLRSAYRETVMAVPHYDDVYGEPLDVHVAAELSAELATGFQRGSIPFTDVYKTQLVDAVSRAVAQRAEFCEDLEAELDSLASGRETLTDLLGRLDGTRIPAGEEKAFEADLDDLAETRQRTVGSRNLPGRRDGHDLCAYLYGTAEWTYPVLTAVARLRGAVSLRADGDRAARSVEVHN